MKKYKDFECMKKISLNLEKCFETITNRLQFSKILIILLFLHKIWIFFKTIWGVQTYYWTSPFNSGGSLDPPVAHPMAIIRREVEIKRTL